MAKDEEVKGERGGRRERWKKREREVKDRERWKERER